MTHAISFMCTPLAYHQMKVLQLSRGEANLGKTVQSALKTLVTVMDLTDRDGCITVVKPDRHIKINIS